MRRILVSACLLGQPVRYDGNSKTLAGDIISRWMEAGQIVAICPEVAGGLSVPRAPAELIGGDGAAVANGAGRVVDETGRDVTLEFLAGAQRALALCQQHALAAALLVEGSPSCGSSSVYDGTFSRTRMTGEGVTTALLRAHGILVFSQNNIAQADDFLCAGNH